MRSIHFAALLCVTSLFALPAPVVAQARPELGRMWLFEKPPAEYLKKTYGFVPDPQWFDAVRLAALRFGRGCSAAFVSKEGLILTNHHCVRDNIAANQGEHDWVKDGFTAASIGDEVQLKGLSVRQHVATRDVTAEMAAGLAEGADAATKEEHYKRNQQKIVAAATEADPKHQHEVVALFQGALRHLYSYKVYEDVRLVVAPHLQAAHFGGDFDNFTYPRYGIDFAFCRAYENGKPADTAAHYYKWSTKGPSEGDLVFVIGNPGRTDRLMTKAQFENQRDARLPRIRQLIDNRLVIMRALAAKSPEAEKSLRGSILSFENAQKAYRGMHEGLLRDRFMAAKNEAEAQFRAALAAKPELAGRYDKVFGQMAEVAAGQTALEGPSSFHGGGGSVLLERALTLLEIAEALVDGHDPAPLQKTLAAMPVAMDAQQTAFFIDHLERARNWLPQGDAYLAAVLGTMSAPEAVARLAATTKVGDPATIAAWLKEGPDAIRTSDDPALVMARVIRPLQQKNRHQMAELNSRLAALGEAVGRALFEIYGLEISPDATGTMRFSDGIIKGYDYNGTKAPWRTTFFSMFGRSLEFDLAYPFSLPEAWLDARKDLDLSLGVNFVCTNDSTGGNSGSAVINRQQEVVGLLFDGNIECLPNDFMFDDRVARSVCVHVHAILESMRKVYNAERIVEELLAPR